MKTLNKLKILLMIMSLIVLFTGCAPKSGKNTVDEKDNTEQISVGNSEKDKLTRDDIDKEKYDFNGLVTSNNIDKAEDLIGKTNYGNRTDNLTEDDYDFLNKDIELFGYQGHFSAEYSDYQNFHEYFDYIVWTSNDMTIDFANILEPMIIFYGDEYEVTSQPTTTYKWELSKSTISCWKNEDGSCAVAITGRITENVTYKPQIGMTADEVLQSTWGEPSDINKTTYAWGTKEQWCYPEYKYIYFENGVVTAIQE